MPTATFMVSLVYISTISGYSNRLPVIITRTDAAKSCCMRRLCNLAASTARLQQQDAALFQHPASVSARMRPALSSSRSALTTSVWTCHSSGVGRNSPVSGTRIRSVLAQPSTNPILASGLCPHFIPSDFLDYLHRLILRHRPAGRPQARLRDNSPPV